MGETLPMLEDAGGVDESRSKFSKLSNKLAKKKGVTDPDALAASIGIKKFGKEGMAKKAAAGKAKAAK